MRCRSLGDLRVSRHAGMAALFLVLAGCTMASSSQSVSAVPTFPPVVSLGSFIDQALSVAPANRASWGIRIEEEDGTLLYERNSTLLMTQASNRKLFLAAAAAHCWDPAKTFRTELLIAGPVVGGTLGGDLIIRGGGDPSLGGRQEDERDRALRPILDALERRGISRISGGVVADVSRFDRQLYVPSWELEDIGMPNASAVDALTFNEGNVGVTIASCGGDSITTDPPFLETESRVSCGPETSVVLRTSPENVLIAEGTVQATPSSLPYADLISVSSPGLYAAAAIHDFLERHQIEIVRKPSLTPTRREGEQIGELESLPLVTLVSMYLEESVNLFGDVLFKNLSAEQTGRGSFGGSRLIERDFLTRDAQIPADEFEFVDGSGLSTRNKATPAAVIRILRFMQRQAQRGFFEEALASPGDAGTMRERLGELSGRVYTKTGTLTGVSALSGFVRGSGGRVRYFSIIANNLPAGASVREIVNTIVRRIADF